MIASKYTEEAQEMFNRGHTFYAIAHQISQWFTIQCKASDIEKVLKVKDNPVGHEKFRS